MRPFNLGLHNSDVNRIHASGPYVQTPIIKKLLSGERCQLYRQLFKLPVPTLANLVTLRISGMFQRQLKSLNPLNDFKQPLNSGKDFVITFFYKNISLNEIAVKDILLVIKP